MVDLDQQEQDKALDIHYSGTGTPVEEIKVLISTKGLGRAIYTTEDTSIDCCTVSVTADPSAFVDEDDYSTYCHRDDYVKIEEELEPTINCNQCGQKFFTKGDLKAHKRNEHRRSKWK